MVWKVLGTPVDSEAESEREKDFRKFLENCLKMGIGNALIVLSQHKK